MRAFFILACLIMATYLSAMACHAKPLAVLLLEHEQPSAWNDKLKKGFENAAAEHGFEAKVALARPGKDQAASFASAVQNADLAIVASDNLHETLRDNAAKFRRVRFGSIDASIRAANVLSVTFADEEAACLAGNAAAMFATSLDGKNAVIGWLSGENSPAMRSLYNGFVEGAKLANGNIRVAQTLMPSPDDVAGAETGARKLLDQGARVIVLAAGGGNTAAAKTLEHSKAWIIPLDDRFTLANTLGWLWRRPDLAARDIIASAAGKFRAKEIDIRKLADDYVNFELSEKLAIKHKTLFNNMQRRMKELRAEIMSGELRLPSLRARTLCDCLD